MNEKQQKKMADFIRKVIDSTGLSQRQVALQKLKISPRFLNMILQNDRQVALTQLFNILDNCSEQAELKITTKEGNEITFRLGTEINTEN